MAIESALIALDLLGVLLCLIGFFDAKRRPDWAWQVAGQNKTLWVVLDVLGFIFGMGLYAGLIIGVIYFSAIRPKVALAQKGGAPTEAMRATPPLGKVR